TAGLASLGESIHCPVDIFGQGRKLLHRTTPPQPILLHTAYEIEEFETLRAQFLGGIGQAHSPAAWTRCSRLQGMAEKSVLDEQRKITRYLQLWTTQTTGDAAHTAVAIHRAQQLEGARIEAHGVGNSRSHLQGRAHALWQKLQELFPLIGIAH